MGAEKIRIVYMMRHGDAVAGADDSARPLSEKGRREVKRVAEFLSRQGSRVDVFYSSFKLRAQETAGIVKDIVNPKAVIHLRDDINPNDLTESIFAEMARWPGNEMVVSHLPFLPKLVSRLTTGQEDERPINLPTGSVAVLAQTSSRHWKIQKMILPEKI